MELYKLNMLILAWKQNFFLTRFGGTFGTLRFNEKSFFNTLRFTPNWDCKPSNSLHVHSPGVYTSDKILNLSTIDKTLLKCDCIDGSILDGVGQLILYSSVLNKPAGYKIFSEPETIDYRKVNISVLNTISFFRRW